MMLIWSVPASTRTGSPASWRRCLSAILPLAALLLGVASPAGAQGLSGTVTEAESRQPVSAALVQLLSPDSDSILASSATNEQGRFRFLSLPAPRYRVRILRIGFRPWTSEPIAREGGASDLVFSIPAVPVVLSDITVEVKSSCRSSPTDDEHIARVWDDARTALALLQTEAGPHNLEFRGGLTRRMVDPGGHLVSESKDFLSSLGAWPISSLPAESLAQRGFVQAKDTIYGPVYYGPDVNVFFSDAFIRTHCFKLVQEKDTTLLGLRFEPAKGRTLPDIEGVLWVSRDRNRLQRLEYRYTGLWSWVPRGRSGGQLDFTFLADGRPALTAWSIRAPVARIQDWPEGARVRDQSTIPYFGHGKVTLHGFREENGLVQEIRLPDGGILWQWPGMTEGTRIPSGGVERP